MYCVTLVLACFIAMATSDMYLHNPRGSNNRQDESNRNRRNANRIFDSQNNNRGGYNTGKAMYYYAGSKLQIEWTNQHQCGGDNANCNIIIQYMCSDLLRDGTTIKSIPLHNNKCNNNKCNEDEQFGMHEPWEYYQLCRNTRQNNLLFTADQNLTQNSATFTRQNPGATRRGYECPEERDYYPYWRPSPWIDIAILANDVNQCGDYLSETENIKGRGYCHHETYNTDIYTNSRKMYPRMPITEVECQRFKYKGTYGIWKTSQPHNAALPKCIKAPASRDNHLGNGKKIQPNTFEWTLPQKSCKKAVLRIRYNISTNDYKEETNFNSNGVPAKIVNIGELVGLSNEEAHKRGYVFKNDPQVLSFGGEHREKLKLAIALNTAQYGRVFQDRSHVFEIRENPPINDCTAIHNINVRGKRGNIVQTFPAVEYDFVPNTLDAKVGDCIHFQWTGSDNNNKNNNGEGTAKTDRSNVIQLDGPVYNLETPYNEHGQLARNYPENLTDVQFLGFERNLLVSLATLRDGVDPLLNNAEAYYDLGVQKIQSAGTFNYMCTRNNNFSNRSQKGRIVVTEKAPAEDAYQKNHEVRYKESNIQYHDQAEVNLK